MKKSAQIVRLHANIPDTLAGKRLDQALAILFPEHSRSRLKSWIDEGQVLVQGAARRPKDKVHLGEDIDIEAALPDRGEWIAEDIALHIVYEDDHIIILNKPADLVVHPGAGNQQGTLVNALLHHVPHLSVLPRAGIVHRLDKDTTGLMVVSKSLSAHTALVEQLQARNIIRVYETIVWGILPAGGTVNAPIARHPADRMRMAVVLEGKSAVTHYRIIKKYRRHTHLRVQLETGRTHQIRVHMAHIRHPVVGDKIYARRFQGEPRFGRQALHAKYLELTHPVTKEQMSWEAPLPEDMLDLLNRLE
jgi:23S rRNA pseudouridine1911/1915/1917 synthase